jgi:hypothetical protein
MALAAAEAGRVLGEGLSAHGLRDGLSTYLDDESTAPAPVTTAQLSNPKGLRRHSKRHTADI